MFSNEYPPVDPVPGSPRVPPLQTATEPGVEEPVPPRRAERSFRLLGDHVRVRGLQDLDPTRHSHLKRGQTGSPSGSGKVGMLDGILGKWSKKDFDGVLVVRHSYWYGIHGVPVSGFGSPSFR